MKYTSARLPRLFGIFQRSYCGAISFYDFAVRLIVRRRSVKCKRESLGIVIIRKCFSLLKGVASGRLEYDSEFLSPFQNHGVTNRSMISRRENALLHVHASSYLTRWFRERVHGAHRLAFRFFFLRPSSSFSIVLPLFPSSQLQLLQSSSSSSLSLLIPGKATALTFRETRPHFHQRSGAQ